MVSPNRNPNGTFKKGHIISAETRAKMSKAHKGVPLSPERITKKRLRRHSAETKAKMSTSQKRRHKERGPFLKGQTAWNKGSNGVYHHTQEFRRRLSEDRKGAKNPAWLGGTSFEPYSPEWTEELRTKIKCRDKHTCQNCGAPGNIIHHIDYNKKNQQESNLITLCSSCHGKTCHNRDQWTPIFEGGMILKSHD